MALWRWAFLLVIVINATANANEKAIIEISVIEARSGPPHLHEALRPMWDLLKRSFGEKFAYYELLQSSSKTVDVEGKVETTLPGGDLLTVTFEGVTSEKGLIRLLVEGGELRTKVRIKDGATFFLAGRKVKEGTLVIGIKARLD